MTTAEMVNLIRANNQPLSHKALRAIADRLEEQDAHLRSALATLNTQGQVVTDQEEQLRGLGGELAESERHRQIMTVQNSELLARCDLLERELLAYQSAAKNYRDVTNGIAQQLVTIGEALAQ